MKSKKELNELKIEVEALSAKLAELSEDELAQVTGGITRVEVGALNCEGYFFRVIGAEGQPVVG